MSCFKLFVQQAGATIPLHRIGMEQCALHYCKDLPDFDALKQDLPSMTDSMLEEIVRNEYLLFCAPDKYDDDPADYGHIPC